MFTAETQRRRDKNFAKEIFSASPRLGGDYFLLRIRDQLPHLSHHRSGSAAVVGHYDR